MKKLLLLGAGESGKSTLFKALTTIYGNGFPETERRGFTPVIWNNVISAMKTLAENSHTYGPAQTSEAQAAVKVFIQELNGDEELNARITNLIQVLWNDPGIKTTYNNRAKFQLFDGAQYFFDRITVLSATGYLPDDQDILRCRIRTTGIVETDFEIAGNKFKMLDVGGQRNERKKWIHCFEEVTAVIFVVALSEYDQVLFEDETTNRMYEALVLFDEVCNSKWFLKTSMILFLNKRDLFAKKIGEVPLTVCFPDYKGPEYNYEAGCNYIQQQFELKNRTAGKLVYSHITCATDTNNVATVFDAVKDIVIRKSLGDAGLI